MKIKSILKFIAIICLPFCFSACEKPKPFSPTDEFYILWTDFQEAKELESKGDTKNALKKFNGVLIKLKILQKNDPNWNPLIIEYRFKKTREAIQRLTICQECKGDGVVGNPSEK